MPDYPDTWYQYDFPLTEVPGAPVPSEANYDPENVAPLIESITSLIGLERNGATFVYENNTPGDTDDDIEVDHPDDQDYLPAYLDDHSELSPEQEHYEEVAKESDILKLFQDNSPAGIEYFQPH